MFYHLRILHIKCGLFKPPSCLPHSQLLPYLPPLLFLSSFMCSFLTPPSPLSVCRGVGPFTSACQAISKASWQPIPSSLFSCKHQKWWGLLGSRVFWRWKAIAPMNSQPLWQCAQDLHKIKIEPARIRIPAGHLWALPSLVELSFVSLPLCKAALGLLNTWIN